MLTDNEWPKEFASVIACTRCTVQTCKSLLRDSQENIPQPGFIGRNFDKTGLMLVGQNPAITKSPQALAADMPYTKAIRQLRDTPTAQTLQALMVKAREFMPSWRVHQDYFPLNECGVTLDDIAYLNVVRCRTARIDPKKGKLVDTPPNDRVANTCVSVHFSRWVGLLQPRVIIFLGKYAWDYGQEIATTNKIPFDYLDRERSRPSHLRLADRNRVAQLVRELTGRGDR